MKKLLLILCVVFCFCDKGLDAYKDHPMVGEWEKISGVSQEASIEVDIYGHIKWVYKDKPSRWCKWEAVGDTIMLYWEENSLSKAYLVELNDAYLTWMHNVDDEDIFTHVQYKK